MPDNSFDVVSVVDMPEVLNAIQQARKEADFMLNDRRMTQATDRLISYVRAMPRFGLASVG